MTDNTTKIIALELTEEQAMTIRWVLDNFDAGDNEDLSDRVDSAFFKISAELRAANSIR